MSRRSLKIISIMSGKGGVGKSTLSLNLARVLADYRRVVLVDLDIANRGCTGILAAYQGLNADDVNSFLASDLSRPVQLEQIKTCSSNSDLYFLPSKLDSHAASISVDGELESTISLVQALVEKINNTVSPDVIILDCHGGLETMVLAAYSVSSDAVIITEPDIATFNGTEILVSNLKHIEEKKAGSTKIHFLLNKIPGKYNYRDLSSLYEALAGKELGVHAGDEESIIYFPTEKYLQETFGEYPFQVDIAPRSLFKHKVDLLCYYLLKDDLPAKHTGRVFRSQRFRKKIAKRIRSPEEGAINSVLYSYLAVLVFVFVLFPLQNISYEKLPVSSLANELFPIVSAVLGVPIFLYGFYGGIRMAVFLIARSAIHWRSFSLSPTNFAHSLKAARLSVAAILMLLVFSMPLVWFVSTEFFQDDFLYNNAYAGLDAEERALLPSQAGQYTQQAIDGSLSARTRLLNQGYALAENITGRFANGALQTMEQLVLEAGAEYWLVGGCDRDCFGLSIEVEPNANVVEGTTNQGDTPEVNVVALGDTTLDVILRIKNCSAYPCYYSLAIYSNSTVGPVQPSPESILCRDIEPDLYLTTPTATEEESYTITLNPDNLGAWVGLRNTGNVILQVRGNGLDPTLRIFDETCREIAYDDDGGSNQDSRIAFDGESSDYIAHIETYNGNNSGEMVLVVSRAR